MNEYWRTYDIDGGQCTHLGGFNDSGLCGVDLAGDDEIHRREPVQLNGVHRVTCQQCKQIIARVKEHIKSREESK